MKKRKLIPLSILLLISVLGTTGCTFHLPSYYSKNKVFSEFDLSGENKLNVADCGYNAGLHVKTSAETKDVANIQKSAESFEMIVTEDMRIYKSESTENLIKTLKPGESVVLSEIENNADWMMVSDTFGNFMGYTNEGFLKAINSGCETYAELPIEYGKAQNNDNAMIDAYSHLVDIRKYFKVYESKKVSNKGVDLSKYDLKVSMKLSTDETTIQQPFYNRNLCMLQYDTVKKLKMAVELFKRDGYKIVIYDAYRPTSVQKRWFNVVRVHAWVADPSIGLGGVHDRGVAIDMSLIDSKGKELEMPTPMHTFSEASSRFSTTMSKTARKNMDYMLGIMLQCGFGYINSEWWHFQDLNVDYYLPTDHPIDKIPLVTSEITR